MKNILRFTSLLLVLFSFNTQAVFADDIPVVTVTATRDSPGSAGGIGGGTPAGNSFTGAGSTQSYADAKRKEEEARKAAAKQKYDECMAVARTANSACLLSAITQLDLDQSTCLHMTEIAAGAGAVGSKLEKAPNAIVSDIGIALQLVGIIGAPASAYCYVHATNTKDKANIICNDNLLNDTEYCKTTSGYTGS